MTINMTSNLIPVLDKGYVRLIDTMGGDLAVINAARASYLKEVDEISRADANLIGFLMREGHFSTLRHSFVTFEVKAPLMIARQWWKYCVGSNHTDPMIGWNESCFPGGQELIAFSSRKKYSVKDLHATAQKNKAYLPKVASLKNGEIISNKIKDVWKVAPATVYEVELETGATLRTTGNHRYLTDNGYVELDNLNPGDYIMANGVAAYKDKEWLEKHYVSLKMTQKDIAVLCKCSLHTIRKWVSAHGLQQDQVMRMIDYNKLNGVWGKGLTAAEEPKLADRAKKTGDNQRGIPKIRGILNGNFKFDNVKDPTTGRKRAQRIIPNPTCRVCGSKAQIHHIDENSLNNEIGNLDTLCQGHHDIAHGKHPILLPHLVKIKSITEIGIEDVYDIEMEDEPNLVVGTVIVHNSRRYITSQEEFYEIKSTEWRSKPENSKQGSGLPIDSFTGSFYTDAFKRWAQEGQELYVAAMEAGVCAEQARVFLPAYSLYVTWRWSCSLQGLIHFLTQRLGHDAQIEMQKYASAVHRLAQPHFPITFTNAELMSS